MMLNQPQHNGHILAGSLDYGASSGNMISASSSRMFTNYEISDDLTRVHVQHLERKYGGRMRAHNAATRIQKAFRHYRLEQLYRQQVLGHPSARRQIGDVDSSALPNSALQKSAIERNAHFRRLAKSQPSLKYQPVTSLRAQLQAERQVNSSRGAPHQPSSSASSNICSPRHVAPLKTVSQQRPYMELMSPRLSQRRVVCPNPNNANSTFIPHINYASQHQPLEDSPLHHGQTTQSPEDIQEVAGLKPSDINNHYFRSSSPLHSATARGSSPHHQGVWLPRLSVLNSSIINSNEVSKHSQQTAIYHSNSLPRMGKVVQGNMPVEVGVRQIANIQPQNHLPQQQPRKQMREWTDQQRRRLYRIALNFFNKKPERGIQLLIGWGFVDENPRSVAKLFVERRGLSKQMIGEFLGTIKSPFHNAVLESFFNEIPMYDMEIDRALRQILTFFRLPGEAQKIDHIMQAFAKRYRACNPSHLPVHISADTVYILAFAIIMLNTDLHSPSLKDSKRMKLEEFVKNIRGIEEGKLLDKQLLQGIYERVKEFEFRSGSDHVTQVMKVDQSIIGKDKPKLVEPHRRLICYCRLHQIQDANRKQAPTVHQREIFLFNDLMLIAKVFNKRKSTVGQYTLRSWSTLIGMRIEEFQNAFYSHGLLISCPDGQELLFNAKNNDDRYRFMADIRESVAEATEMEQLRLEMELDKQSGRTNGTRTTSILNKQSISTRTDTQRDSGLPDLDQPSPVLNAPTVNFSGCIPSSSPSTATTTSATANSTPIKQLHLGNGVRCVPVTIPSVADCSQLPNSSMAGGPSSTTLPNGGVVAVSANTSVIRRLSFNSLDSGMVEETNDFSA